MSAANPERGEAALRVGGATVVLRPSFAALVAAEGELGPLFALVERAAAVVAVLRGGEGEITPPDGATIARMQEAFPDG